MRVWILAFCFLAAGCGGTAFYLPFSPGYDSRTSLTHALPAIELRPGETRKGIVSTPRYPWRRAVRIFSEDPRIVIVWHPPKAGDLVHVQAIAPGQTLLHYGEFPFEPWNPRQNLIERTRWRWALKKYLSPEPDEVAFRNISDQDLWRQVLRSHSRGALRIVVQDDPLQFWREDRPVSGL